MYELFGFDWAVAMTIDRANALISRELGGMEVGVHYDGTDSVTGIRLQVDAVVGVWRILPGGSGQSIRIGLPIRSGTYAVNGLLNGAGSLVGSLLVLEVPLQWTDGSDAPERWGSGSRMVLTIALEETLTDDAPEVTVLDLVDPTTGVSRLTGHEAESLAVKTAFGRALWAAHGQLETFLRVFWPTPVKEAAVLKPTRWTATYSEAAGTPVIAVCAVVDSPSPDTPAFDTTVLTNPPWVDGAPVSADTFVLISPHLWYRQLGQNYGAVDVYAGAQGAHLAVEKDGVSYTLGVHFAAAGAHATVLVVGTGGKPAAFTQSMHFNQAPEGDATTTPSSSGTPPLWVKQGMAELASLLEDPFSWSDDTGFQSRQVGWNGVCFAVGTLEDRSAAVHPALLAQLAAPAAPSRVRTFEWDSVIAVRAEALTAAIAAAKASPSGFTYEAGGLTIGGSFGDWRFVGGTGTEAHLDLPVENVTVTGGNGLNFSLASGTFRIALTLDFLSDVVPGASPRLKLVVKGSNLESPDPDAAVHCISQSDLPPGASPIIVAAVADAVAGWCSSNLSAFSWAFATADIAEALTGGWAFCRPKAVGYAVSDGVLGVLCRTVDADTSGLPRVLDVNAIPAGQHASLVLSEKTLLQNLLIPALTNAYPYISADDLEVVAIAGVPGAPPKLQLRAGVTLHPPSVEHDSHTYHPVMTTLEVTILGQEVQVYSISHVDLLDGYTSYNTALHRYTLTFDAASQKIDWHQAAAPEITRGVSGQGTSQVPVEIAAVGVIIIGACLAPCTDGLSLAAGGVIAGLLLGADQIADAVIEDINEGDAPDIDLLIANAVSPITWTGAGVLTVEEVQFNGAFQIAGRMPGVTVAAEVGAAGLGLAELGGGGGSTNGWDIVSVLTYTQANAAIGRGWTAGTVPGLAGSYLTSTVAGGTFGAWQIIEGGSGGAVRFRCPLTAGTFTDGSTTQSLVGVSVDVQVSMAWVPVQGEEAFSVPETDTTTVSNWLRTGSGTDGAEKLQAAFAAASIVGAVGAPVRRPQRNCWSVTVTQGSTKTEYYLFTWKNRADTRVVWHVDAYAVGDTWRNQLRLAANQADGGSETVLVTGIDGTDTWGSATLAALKLQQIFTDWLNDHLSSIRVVLAEVDLLTAFGNQEKADKTKPFAWALPTTSSYAVTEDIGGGVIALLAMTEGRAAPGVDTVSPDVLPAGSDGAILVRGDLWLEKALLPAVQVLFARPDTSDFSLSEGVITNVRALEWRYTNLTFQVPERCLSLALSGETLSLSLVNVAVPGVQAGFDVTMGFEESIRLTLDTSTGNLWFEPVGQPLTTIDVQEGSGSVDASIVSAAIGFLFTALAVGAEVGPVIAAARAARAAGGAVDAAAAAGARAAGQVAAPLADALADGGGGAGGGRYFLLDDDHDAVELIEAAGPGVADPAPPPGAPPAPPVDLGIPATPSVFEKWKTVLVAVLACSAGGAEASALGLLAANRILQQQAEGKRGAIGGQLGEWVRGMMKNTLWTGFPGFHAANAQLADGGFVLGLAVTPPTTLALVGGAGLGGADPAPAPAVTNDWDLVFAIRDAHVNNALTAAWPTMPAGIRSLSGSLSGYAVEATFGAWALEPQGQGTLMELSCPLATGHLTQGGRTVSLAGGLCSVLVSLDWLPDLGEQQLGVTTDAQAVANALDEGTVAPALAAAFTAAGIRVPVGALVKSMTPGKAWGLCWPGSNWAVLFSNAVAAQAVEVYKVGATWPVRLQAVRNDPTAPVNVQVSGINGLTGLDGPAIEAIVTSWFEANLGKFNYVFATADYATSLDQSDGMHWARPTSVGYAVSPTSADSTGASGMLGVLSMTEGRSAPIQALSPDAIPAGADAALLISGPRFVQNMLLTGAMQIFAGSTAADFTFTNDGLTVQNAKALTWGNFQMPDAAPGELSTVMVEAGNFRLSLDETVIQLELDEVELPYNPDLITKVTYRELVTLSLRDRGDGTHALWFDPAPNGKHLDVSCIKTKEAIVEDIVLGAVSFALALLAFVGAAVSAVVDVAGAATVAADGAAGGLTMGAEALEAGEEAADAPAIASDTARSAGQVLRQGWTSFRGAMRLPMFKVAMGLSIGIGALDGVLALEDACDQLAARNWKALPAFDGFAKQLLAPVQFTKLPSLVFTGAKLNGAVQISFVVHPAATLALTAGPSVHAGLWNAAKARVSARGDGRLGIDDARALFALLSEDGVYSEVEKHTLRHIRETLKWTEAGDAEFRRLVRSMAAR